MPALVGSNGVDEVRVVASRVGLKRRDEACIQSTSEVKSNDRTNNTDFALPEETVISEVIKHCFLCLAQIFGKIFLREG